MGRPVGVAGAGAGARRGEAAETGPGGFGVRGGETLRGRAGGTEAGVAREHRAPTLRRRQAQRGRAAGLFPVRLHLPGAVFLHAGAEAYAGRQGG